MSYTFIPLNFGLEDLGTYFNHILYTFLTLRLRKLGRVVHIFLAKRPEGRLVGKGKQRKTHLPLRHGLTSQTSLSRALSLLDCRTLL
jgi:hypothetical protein